MPFCKNQSYGGRRMLFLLNKLFFIKKKKKKCMLNITFLYFYSIDR